MTGKTRATTGLLFSAILAAALVLPEVLVAPEAGDRRIGGVTRTKATVTGQLGEQRRKLRKNLPVYQNEEVKTGSGARAVLKFRDGSVLRIGADAEVVLDDYVYQGTGGVIRLLRGAIRFTSGPRGRSGLRIKSPVATIGIRGTDFWVGEMDDGYGVLLFQGVVTVSNEDGHVVLDRPSQGTFIDSASKAPTTPVKWTSSQQEGAVAGVTIGDGPICKILKSFGKGNFGSCS